MKKKLAIFDFCDTLINFQTASPFLYFALRRTNRFWWAYELVRRILRLLGVLSGTRNKKFQVKCLRGVKYNELEEAANIFAKEHLQKAGQHEIVDEVCRHISNGHEIVVVSGGFKIYIETYLKQSFDVNIDVIANDLEIKNGRLTGRICGQDCMGVVKINKLAEAIDLSKYELRKSFSYSDHESDIPLFMLTGNPFLVTKTGRPDWAKILEIGIINVK